MSWLRQLFSRRRIYGDLSEEIREHLEEKIEELVAGGMSRKEATYSARREFGSVRLTEEDSRAVWRWAAFEDLFMDVRFGRKQKTYGLAKPFRCNTYKKHGGGSSAPLPQRSDVLTFQQLAIRQSQHTPPCYHRRCCLRFSQESEPGMTARTLDGQKIRDQIFAELSDEVRLLTAAGVRPGLAAVLVGENPASQLYVKSKIAACQQLGLSSALLTPPGSVTTLDLLAVVEDLNRDNDVDGILVQLPLPPQVDTKRILEAVDPAKDVDGFHPVNLGRLISGRPGLVACTPAGCMEILRRNEIKIEGANAVVLGRSDIVGKPMALLLMHANATVTICHSKTRDLPDVLRRADIIVAAMGKAGYVEADWIRSATAGGPGATVIDVGTNRVTDPKEAERLFHNFPERLEKFRVKGSALVGDVHPGAVNVAGALTPVPGGVGPMTITMLMSNTVKAARLRRASPKFSATQSTASAR